MVPSYLLPFFPTVILSSVPFSPVLMHLEICFLQPFKERERAVKRIEEGAVDDIFCTLVEDLKRECLRLLIIMDKVWGGGVPASCHTPH